MNFSVYAHIMLMDRKMRKEMKKNWAWGRPPKW